MAQHSFQHLQALLIVFQLHFQGTGVVQDYAPNNLRSGVTNILNYFSTPFFKELVNCLFLSIYKWLGVISCLLVIISSCDLLFTIVNQNS